jgi:hypothetical protein
MTMKPQPEGMHREARQESRKPDPNREGKLLPADEYDIFDGKEHAGVTQRAKGGWRGLPDGVPLPDGNLPPVQPTHGVAMQYIRDQRARLAASNGQAAMPDPVPPPVAPAANIDTGGLHAEETESIRVIPDSPTEEQLAAAAEHTRLSEELDSEEAALEPPPGEPSGEPAPSESPSEAPPEGLIPEVVEPQEFHDPFAEPQGEEPDLSKEFPFA